jgi:hypothetical protein
MFPAKIGFEVAKRIFPHNPENKRPTVKRVIKTIGVSALIGAGLGMTHGVGSSVTEKIEGGHATVEDIDRKLSRQEVIGFKTRVNGAFAEDTEKFEPGLFGIAPADFVTSMRTDNLVVLSNFCLNSVDKKVKHYIDEKRYVVEIDPADISVCSKKDPNTFSTTTPGGSANQFVDGASQDLVRAFKEATGIDINDPKVIEKQNILKSELTQTAENAGIYLVNKVCGPKVFDATKEDIKKLIAADITKNRDETVEVIFNVNSSGDVKISGQSDLDQFFAEKEKGGDRTHKVESIGTCELAKDLVKTGGAQ